MTRTPPQATEPQIPLPPSPSPLKPLEVPLLLEEKTKRRFGENEISNDRANIDMDEGSDGGSVKTLEESWDDETRVDNNEHEHDDFDDILTTETDEKHPPRMDDVSSDRERDAEPLGNVDESVPAAVDSAAIAAPTEDVTLTWSHLKESDDTKTALDAAHGVELPIDDALASEPVASASVLDAALGDMSHESPTTSPVAADDTDQTALVLGADSQPESDMKTTGDEIPAVVDTDDTNYAVPDSCVDAVSGLSQEPETDQAAHNSVSETPLAGSTEPSQELPIITGENTEDIDQAVSDSLLQKPVGDTAEFSQELPNPTGEDAEDTNQATADSFLQEEPVGDTTEFSQELPIPGENVQAEVDSSLQEPVGETAEFLPELPNPTGDNAEDAVTDSFVQEEPVGDTMELSQELPIVTASENAEEAHDSFAVDPVILSQEPSIEVHPWDNLAAADDATSSHQTADQTPPPVPSKDEIQVATVDNHSPIEKKKEVDEHLEAELPGSDCLTPVPEKDSMDSSLQSHAESSLTSLGDESTPGDDPASSDENGSKDQELSQASEAEVNLTTPLLDTAASLPEAEDIHAQTNEPSAEAEASSESPEKVNDVTGDEKVGISESKDNEDAEDPLPKPDADETMSPTVDEAITQPLTVSAASPTSDSAAPDSDTTLFEGLKPDFFQSFTVNFGDLTGETQTEPFIEKPGALDESILQQDSTVSSGGGDTVADAEPGVSEDAAGTGPSFSSTTHDSESSDTKDYSHLWPEDAGQSSAGIARDAVNNLDLSAFDDEDETELYFDSPEAPHDEGAFFLAE
ncbi:hypothetical protein BT96DRAFT_917215 [Gymnopus androsaceus JB14]|uniref:Uncharacterized protein n=1 Tax=Gymnopus androsaceus JB14 TaxID=1447944 RepID=A0A6A4I329_9AGAR|nr:hypothetical protein BT96DRAFT_917215 [Gymnopus androsaceus JB14]